MSLTNAIAIIRRQDAQVKVEVPATGNRKAYSYMREGNPANPKSGVSKKAIAAGIGGAIAGGALTAGILAMRRAKKGEDPKAIAGDDAIDVESREVSNAVKGTSSKGAIAQGQDPQRKKPLVTPPPVGSDRILVTPEPKQSGVVQKGKGFLNRGADAVVKIAKEGVERHNEAIAKMADREVDLTKAAYDLGSNSRIAAQNFATFAKASVEGLGKKQPKSVEVKAVEVTEALPEGKPMKKESKAPKEPKPKKAKTPKEPKAPKPKQPKPTKAEWNAVQKQLNDLNK